MSHEHGFGIVDEIVEQMTERSVLRCISGHIRLVTNAQ